jgi:hypothetical protein
VKVEPTVPSCASAPRALWHPRGSLDFVAKPDTEFGSNATVNLNITIKEGPQYHMGKLDIVADKEVAGPLRPAWKLAEGDVHDRTYIDEYLQTNRDLLPLGFSRANVRIIQNCPDVAVAVGLIIDPAEDNSHAVPNAAQCSVSPRCKTG